MAAIFKQTHKNDLHIISSVFDPYDIGEKKDILYKKSNKTDRKLYRVFLYIDGVSSNLIESVEYQLHRSFKRNIVEVSKSLTNLNASITIWTWGLFEVRAKVKLSNDRTIELKHYLDYDNQIKNNKSRLKLEK